MGMSRQERVGLHTNQKRIQASNSMPAISEITEGKPVFRETHKGLYEYVKFRGEVYSTLLTKHTRSLEEEINETVKNITIEEITLSGTLDVSSGGTGATTLTEDGVLFGNGTAAVSAVDLSTNGNIVAGGAAPAAVTGANLAGAGLGATTGNGTLVIAAGAGTLIDVGANDISVDLNEAAAAVMAAGDGIIFVDADDSNVAKQETLQDLLDTVAGTVATTGIDRSGATLVVSDLHPVGVDGSANQLLTDDGDGTVTSESDLLFASNVLYPTATAHNAVGKALTVSAGDTTAGTTNNIAGGALTFQGGQGKGTGSGGDIIFQTANAAGSTASSLNALATALTISDDISSTFSGDVHAPNIKDNDLLQGPSGDMWELKVDEDIDIIVRQDGGGDYADHPITFKDYNKNFLQFFYTTNLAIIKTAAGALNLEINSRAGDISFKKGTSSTGLIFDLDTAGACYIENGAGDAVVAVDDGDRNLYFFDKGGEYIAGDAANLTLTAGTDINLTAGADINIPADKGLTFGDDGEKIEGDGTDLTISSSGDMNLTATGDLLVNAPYAALATGDFDVMLGVTDPETNNGHVFGSGLADYYTHYVWIAMWDLQVSAEYDTDFGSW